MYWRGHVGIALIAYAPFAAAARAVGEPELAALGGAVAIALSTLPDVDQRLPVSHRGPTHTVAFALGVGASTAIAMALVAGASAGLPPWSPAFLGTVATVALCSHLAGDAITPMGIRPFRPFRNAHVTFDLIPAKNPRANRLFLGTGTAAAVIALTL
ncbi:metal-dependent hydrolase [Halorubrum trueperi]|uniref:Metal-dependent hydrolase n=1 Tax=Halorubrum trueperi TaxID=2004704 RepID=A0ABD5UKG8_9EURY